MADQGQVIPAADSGPVHVGAATKGHPNLIIKGGRTVNPFPLRDVALVLERAVDRLSVAKPENIQQVAAAQADLSTAHYRAVLSQAHQSFVSALVATAACVLFILGAAGMQLWLNRFDVATISGLGAAFCSLVAGLNFWLYTRTKDQLGSFHERLERMQRYLLANSVAETLDGPP